MINEGRNDPSIFKAVFLAGGPGSGKSFIVGKTSLIPLGFKLVNSDPFFERGLKKAGLTMDPKAIYSPKGQEVRSKAKAATKKQLSGYIDGRLGLVIDGTGKDFKKIKAQADQLLRLGYDVAMIFVNTNETTALKRNQDRDRSLPDKQVSAMWKEVQNNLGMFQGYFQPQFFVIDNSVGSNYQKQSMTTYKRIMTWAKKLPTNQKVKTWMASTAPSAKLKEDAPAVNTGSIPNPAVTAMGPRKKKKKNGYEAIQVSDRRYKAGKTVLLSRFKRYMADN